MSREELKAYLEAQLDEVRRYQAEQMQLGRAQLEFRRALDEWIERNAGDFQDSWLRDGRHWSFKTRSSACEQVS